jgi:hypothetical protein
VTASQPRHPFTVAWETWQAWSDAEVMRTARGRTAARGESLAVFDQHPEWTQGPGPLQGLAANREVVDHLVGWRWGRCARLASRAGGRAVTTGPSTHPEQRRPVACHRPDSEGV